MENIDVNEGLNIQGVVLELTIFLCIVLLGSLICANQFNFLYNFFIPIAYNVTFLPLFISWVFTLWNKIVKGKSMAKKILLFMLLFWLIIATIFFPYMIYSRIVKNITQKISEEHKKKQTYKNVYSFMLTHIIVTSGGMFPGPLTINRSIEVWINVIAVAILMYSIVYCLMNDSSDKQFYRFLMIASILSTSILKVFSVLKYFIPSLQCERWDKFNFKSDWPQISTFVFSLVVFIVITSTNKSQNQNEKWNNIFGYTFK
ncbi:hypothetical protein M896_010080 [Ordospora colligata OC4]|uniref:Uncharacterized protein n=1 Tax=Ordospora colligata OC4 TaxID=1354746 RepID=A0A0B2UMS0_9MICR|nr:uncharacterized protein M896_010080 [Ordospora colligata OC4]KHN70357.1 hypothetical protein M896_010080 [Ordospora colligata OC4]